MSEPVRPEAFPLTAASLLLRSTAVQVSGGRLLFAAASCLRAGLDRETISTMLAILLNLSDPDTDLVATVLLGLPQFPETSEV